MGRSISSSRAVQENSHPSSGLKSSRNNNNNPNSSIASARGRKPVATSTPYGNKVKTQQKHVPQEQQDLPEENTIQQHMEVSLKQRIKIY